MDISKVVRDILLRSYNNAKENKNEYVTPEHLLFSALEEEYFIEAIKKLNGDVEELKSDLASYIDEYVDKIEDGEPEESFGIRNILIVATQQAAFSERNIVALEHIIAAIYALKDSYAVFFLEKQGINKQELLFELSHNKSEDENVSKDAIRIIRADKTHEKSNK